MADSREVTYGIGFKVADAISSIDHMEQSLDNVEQSTDRIEFGAQAVSNALGDMGASGTSAAQQVGSAAQDMGKDFQNAGDGIEDKFKQMGANAESFGAAFKSTMGAAIKDGQSLTKSIQTGVGGALSFVQNKFVGFKKDFVTGAKAIGTAILHPAQTIKSKLLSALNDAGKSTNQLGKDADDTGQDLAKMGAEGNDAGNKIKDALSGAVKSIAGLMIIKKGVDALKDFVKNALEAAKATESISAKFDTLFADTDAAAWAQNYGNAIHRSNSEVKGFLVSNQAMYKAMGITGDAANDLSKITTSLAYDFGNAFKMDDADALSMVQDALKGNKDALLEYCISLDDATLKAKAMEMGLGKKIDKLDEASLAQVRMASLIEQTSKVQKAAIEQTGGLTNSTKSLKGIWQNFMEDAGAKFSPVMERFFGIIIDAWPQIEPALMGLVDILANGLAQAMPVLLELGSTLLPVLTSAIGTVFQAVTPLLPVFNTLAQTILPPFAKIISVLVTSLMPPICDILNVVLSLLEPLMPIITSFAESILPPIAQLLGLIAPILQLISPLLDAIAPVLEVIGYVIKAIVGGIGWLVTWLVSGVDKANEFWDQIWQGADKSKASIDGVNDAVSDIEQPSLAVDTSEYTKDISSATKDASNAAEKNIIATKDITDQNLQSMGIEASSTYASMAIDSETAWSRMTKAADEGANKIVSAFQRIASAAEGVSGANISVTGTSMPAHASGTDSFEGGWTHINERGGEVAFLPKGSAIIPADKSDRLIAGMSGKGDGSTFAPSLSITVQGNADQSVIEQAVDAAKTMFKQLYEEARRDEYTAMTIKNAYT